MDIDMLQDVRSEVEANNKEPIRLISLAKFIWTRDMTHIENMVNAMKLSEMAIRSITTVKFYEN